MREITVGVTQLRTMTATKLSELDSDSVVLVLGRKTEGPLAALIPYSLFLSWQTYIKGKP